MFKENLDDDWKYLNKYKMLSWFLILLPVMFETCWAGYESSCLDWTGHNASIPFQICSGEISHTNHWLQHSECWKEIKRRLQEFILRDIQYPILWYLVNVYKKYIDFHSMKPLKIFRILK